MDDSEASNEDPNNASDELKADKIIKELLKMPKPSDTPTDFNAFAVKIHSSLEALGKLGRGHYIYDTTLLRNVLDKMEPYMRSKWCDYAEAAEQSENTAETTKELLLVVLSRFLMLEADKQMKYCYVPGSNSTPNESGNEARCQNCSGAHKLHQCPDYLALEAHQRWDLVREKRLCFRCVEKKHRRVKCKAAICGVNDCCEPHHSTLHEEPSEVLLPMLPVIVKGPKGQVETYAFTCESRMLTTIDHDLAMKIGADGPTEPVVVSHMVGNFSKQEDDSKRVNIQLRAGENTFKLTAHTVRNLGTWAQYAPKCLLRHKHLKDLKPKEVCYDPARPLITVGTDHWDLIETRERRQGDSGPVATRTKLGWALWGSTGLKNKSDIKYLHILPHFNLAE